MKDRKIYHFLTGILRACLKIQFKNWLILILKGFLGVISLTFIPSAIGAKKPISQEIREALDGNMEKSPHTPDLADLAVTPPVLLAETSIDPVLSDLKTSSNESQETKSEISNELMNRIHDIAEYLLSNETNETNESNKNVKVAIISLRQELKEKILSDNLTTLQVIDFLKKKVSENTKYSGKKSAAIRIIGELLINYPLPDNSEVLQVIDFLKEFISGEKTNSYTNLGSLKEIISEQNTNTAAKIEAIRLIGELSKKYILPEMDILQALNQIKEYLFQQEYTKQASHLMTVQLLKQTAILVTVQLLKQVSDTEKQKIIFWIANHQEDQDWENKRSVLLTLQECLKQNILSDPKDRKDIALVIADRITDSNGEIRRQAIIISGLFLKQKDILWDSNEKKKITFMIADKISDPNPKVQQEALATLDALLSEQDVLSDLNDKIDITSMIVNRMSDPNTEVQEAAITATSSLLAQKEIFPDPNKRNDIASTIVNRMSDPNQNIQQAAVTATGFLLTQKEIFTDPNERIDIAFQIIERMTDPNGKAQKEAIAASATLMSQSFLSDSEKSEIAHTIAMLTFDNTQSKSTRQSATAMTKNLWTNSNFFLSEKIKIMQLLAEKLSSVVIYNGKRNIFHVLQIAKQTGMPFDFDMIDKVTNLVSEPPPFGDNIEAFVKGALQDIPLSENGIKERLMIHLKMEQLLAERNQQGQEQLDEKGMTACQKSLL